jgi:hypothetical protein
MVTCQHVFCAGCLQTLLGSSEDNFPPCPVCRQPIVVNPQKGVDTFPTLRIYEDIIRCLELKDGSEVIATLCDACDKTKDLESKCLTCNMALCNRCTVAHARIKATSGHTVLTMEDVKKSPLASVMSQRSTMCPQHVDEIVKLYCGDCNTGICMLCKATVHEKHNCKELTTVATPNRQTLTDLQSQCSDCITHTDRALHDLEIITNNYTASVERAETNIIQTVQAMVDLLEAKKQKLLKSVAQQRARVEKRLQTEQDHVTLKRVAMESLRQFAVTVCSYGTNYEVVNNAPLIHERWRQLNADSVDRLTTDFRIEVKYRPETMLQNSIENLELGSVFTHQYLSSANVASFNTNIDKPVTGLWTRSYDDVIVISSETSRTSVGGTTGTHPKLRTNMYKENGQLSYTQDSVLCLHVSKNKHVLLCSPNGKTLEVRTLHGDIVTQFKLSLNASKISAALTDQDELLLYDGRSLRTYSSPSKLLRKIENQHTQSTSMAGMRLTHDGDVLLFDWTEGRGFVLKVLDNDGALKFRYNLGTSSGVLGLPSVQRGVVSDSGCNLAMCVRPDDCTGRHRLVYLQGTDVLATEILELPEKDMMRPNVPHPQVSSKVDGMMYVVSGNGARVATVRYLS